MAELSALIPSWLFDFPTIESLESEIGGGSMSAADILTAIKTVDGSGSGLDADLLDSHDSAYFLAASTYTAADVLTKLETVDGSGSGLDADLLDGHDSAYFLAASTYTAADVLSKLTGVDGAASGLDADLLDGLNTASIATVSTVMTRGSAGESALVYLTLSGGTQTTSLPMIVATQTWNASGVSFMGVTFDYTITAASSTSRVLRIRGGASGTTTLFDIDKVGTATLAGTLSCGNFGTSVGKANLNLGIATSVAANSTTAETDAVVKTIGAAQIVTAEDRIEGEIWINSTATTDGGTSTFKVYVGGTNRQTLPTVTVDGFIVIRITLVYKGGNAWWLFIHAKGCGMDNYYQITNIGSVNPTSAVTFKVTGTSNEADNPPGFTGVAAYFKLLPV